MPALRMIGSGGKENCVDYLSYYDLEKYLFETVSPRFHENWCLCAFDFFLIVNWKSPRPRRMIRNGLRERGQTNLENAVRDLTRKIYLADDHQTRLEILIDQPGIGLAMATAVLTVLYPEEFTVYDRRVCESLVDDVSQAHVRAFRNLGNRGTGTVWKGYVDFREAVRNNKKAPQHLSLRDKDRWLWAKAVVQQLKGEIQSGE